jgi:hypothetical protein
MMDCEEIFIRERYRVEIINDMIAEVIVTGTGSVSSFVMNGI